MHKKKTIIEESIENLGISSLNEMQETMLREYNEDNDCILLSPTGSGKTLAFLLPLLGKIKAEINEIQILILTPSRELAIQIEKVFKDMKTGHKANCFYGGHSIKIETNNLSQPPKVLIGTPGRIADHIRRDHLNLNNIHSLVLDEFDKSLELGFKDEMSFIIENLKSVKSKILTSATYNIEIPDFIQLTSPVSLDFIKENHAPKLRQCMVRADEKDKLEILFKLLCYIGEESSIIFCNHRDAVERISLLLKDKGIAHDTFHGGLTQEDRERALIKFRNGSHQILITTDLAARGLDIPEIKNVIHYQLSKTESSYIHRNGRTARMNADGVSYLVLAEMEDIPSYINIIPTEINLPFEQILPPAPQWATLFIGGGKKEKINKIDIIGFLHKTGELDKDDIGLLEVKDHISYVAIKRQKIKQLIKLIRNEKIKKKKFKIEISR